MIAADPFVLRLRNALKDSPNSLVVEPGGRVCPGASLHTGGCVLAQALVVRGYRPGDRIGFRGPKGVGFVQALVGTLRAGMVFCPLGPNDPEEGLRTVLDEARLADAFRGELAPPVEGVAEAKAGIRLWTSGSSGERRGITAPTSVLEQQMASHGPLLGLSPDDAIVSYLPWSHAFGGVLELLCGLCAGAEIAIVGGPFDPEILAQALDGVARPWLFSVPKALTGLSESRRGRDALTRIRGGIVGGAPVDRRLCGFLTEFALPLRVGYGQTECGPGVTLGDPGRFLPGYLGRPVGCAVRLAEDGELVVSGRNVCLATSPAAPHERATGDLAAEDGEGGYLFRGRCADGWKWSNGRRFSPHALVVDLPAEVCLLKATGDAVVVVGFEAGFVSPSLSVATVATVEIPAAFHKACRTTNGKLSAKRTAAVLRRLRPDLALDPFLYPADGAEGRTPFHPIGFARSN